VEITSFHGINTAYFTGAYGLWLLFCFTSWFDLIEVAVDDTGIPPSGRSITPADSADIHSLRRNDDSGAGQI
jgi:hypothetical protein